jgi:CheY-like chemotaxis protein
MLASPARRPRKPKARILVAEDDPSFAQLLEDALRRRGHKVERVPNGMDLTHALTTPEAVRRYDVVLCDVRMPHLSGIDVLAITDGRPRPPVIVMTAFAAEPVRRVARELGAVALLSKPFEIDDLHDLVVDVVRRAAANE